MVAHAYHSRRGKNISHTYTPQHTYPAHTTYNICIDIPHTHKTYRLMLHTYNPNMQTSHIHSAQYTYHIPAYITHTLIHTIACYHAHIDIHIPQKHFIHTVHIYTYIPYTTQTYYTHIYHTCTHHIHTSHYAFYILHTLHMPHAILCTQYT